MTAGVMPSRWRPGVLSGRFTKGQVGRLSFCRASYRCSKAFLGEPVPTSAGEQEAVWALVADKQSAKVFAAAFDRVNEFFRNL